MTTKQPLDIPARILSSSDPSVLASDSRQRLTAPSVQCCRRSTCRWSGSCPSRTEARSCTGKSNQGAVRGQHSNQQDQPRDWSRESGHSHCLLDGTNFTGHAQSVVAQSSEADGCTTSQNHLSHSVNCRQEELRQAAWGARQHCLSRYYLSAVCLDGKKRFQNT